VAADAATLHVVARGKGSPGPLVVLVHGSMDRSAGMARVAGRLRDHHVVRYDRRGYGRSRGGDPAVGVGGNVEDLLAVIAAERVGDQPVVVVGHSYGGVVALTAASRHPRLVVAVGTFEAPLPWLAWWPPNPNGAGATARDPSADPGDAADAFLRRMLGDERWEAMPATARHDRRLEGPALVSDMRSLRTGDAPFDVERLPVPVIAGYGTASAPHQRTAAEVLADRSGGEVVAVDGAQHGAHLSHPAAFADLVRRAVARA
jgi:pimeloyl-ACP methyl ester carboxylesterase